MRFKPESTDGANAGLEHARAFLEPIKAKHSWITYADLWTLAGVVAIEAMGGPIIPWKGGRSDVPTKKGVCFLTRLKIRTYQHQEHSTKW